MNVPAVTVLAVFTSLSIQAATIKPPTEHNVKICVTSSGDVWVVTQAETIAARMFADIGVAVEWIHDQRRCKLATAEILLLSLSTGAPDSRLPGALGYSRLHDQPHTEVFYNRVVNSVEPRRVPVLLAHVLAHEITHLLEDLNRHSAEGLMKAHWDEHDFELMAQKTLRFAPEDIDLIQRALRERQALAGARKDAY